MAEAKRNNGYYQYENINLPSVTTILGFCGGSEGLMRWACELGGLGVLWSLRYLKTREEFDNFVSSGAVIEWARERAIRSLEDEQARVQNFGKRVHFGIESHLLKRPVDIKGWTQGEQAALATFDKFYELVQLFPKHVEEALFSPDYRFAGRIDLISDVNFDQANLIKPYLLRSSEPIDPGLLVIDFKTGSFYHESHAMQIAAYRQACLETFGYEPTGGLVINIARENPGAVKCFYYSAKSLDHAFKDGFLHVKSAWEYAGAPKWYRKELHDSLNQQNL